jgi:UDP-N-acetylglucosamine:LPS N-acetylglucosamine transferase
MQPNTPKILILSSDTGGGHRSAAQALTEGLQRIWQGQSIAVRVIKAVEESHHITDKLVGVYNWVLRNKQGWMKYLYWAMNRFRPETREFFQRRCIGFCRDIFEKWCPHIVVSVHPMTQHIFGRILRELNLQDQIPLVTVVTDPCYGFWKGWACEDVSLYLVATKMLSDSWSTTASILQRSRSRVCRSSEIQRSNRSRRTERSTSLRSRSRQVTVFVNAGWIGGGNIPAIFRELIRGELDVQAIFLAGKNEDLRKEAEELARRRVFRSRSSAIRTTSKSSCSRRMSWSRSSEGSRPLKLSLADFRLSPMR